MSSIDLSCAKPSHFTTQPILHLLNWLCFSLDLSMYFVVFFFFKFLESRPRNYNLVGDKLCHIFLIMTIKYELMVVEAN